MQDSTHIEYDPSTPFDFTKWLQKENRNEIKYAVFLQSLEGSANMPVELPNDSPKAPCEHNSTNPPTPFPEVGGDLSPIPEGDEEMELESLFMHDQLNPELIKEALEATKAVMREYDCSTLSNREELPDSEPHWLWTNPDVIRSEDGHHSWALENYQFVAASTEAFGTKLEWESF